MNIAGVNGRQNGIANVEDIEDDDWDFVLGVNLIGMLNCMRAEIHAMKEHGSIVTLGCRKMEHMLLRNMPLLDLPGFLQRS